MKHLTEFESFPLNEERSAKSAWQILDHYMKENPTGKKLAQDCQKLIKAMKGMGTDEKTIYDVFKSIKSKDELVKLIALWDSLDINYEKTGENFFSMFGKILTGKDSAYGQRVESRWSMVSPIMKDMLSQMAFWKNPQGPTEVEKYLNARKAWYDKNPQFIESSLSYWLREELDKKELAELNSIVKKFGFQF